VREAAIPKDYQMLLSVFNRLLPRRIRRQLLVLLVLILGPTLLLQILTYANWYHVRGHSELEASLELARSTASLFAAFVEDVARQELDLGVALSGSSQFSAEQAQHLLRISADENPLVDSFDWAAPDGAIVASSDPQAVGTRADGHPGFQEVLGGQQWAVSDLFEDPASHKETFVVIRGVRDEENRLKGIVLADISMNELASVFASISRSEGGALDLFDRRGSLALHLPAPSGPIETNWLHRDPLLATALAGQDATGTFVSPANNLKCFGSRVPIAPSGWVAGASRPARLTLDPIVRSLLEVTLLAAVFVALSALVYLLLYRRISLSLRLLQEHAAAIGKGDLDRRLTIIDVTELGAVAETFNNMAADLRSARRAEQEAQARLEQRVEERTEALREANHLLRQEVIEREEAQRALIKQSGILEAFYRHTVTPLVFLDRDFNFIRVNEAYARACQRHVSEFPGHNHFEFYPSEELERRFREVVRTKEPYRVFARPFVFPDHSEWGTTYWNLSVSPIVDATGKVEFLVFSLEDVTQRTVTEKQADVVSTLHELFATRASLDSYLGSVVDVIRSWSGCENVGVRVVDQQRRVPYGAHVGFTPEFMSIENCLSLDKDACACIRVIAGTPEPQDATAMTVGGSFRCDNTIEWVQRLTPEQQARFRGRCISSGYATVAVIPIRYRDEPVGAVHLADARPGMVSPDNAAFLESLAPLIGEAIHRFHVEEALGRSSRYARSLIEASLDPLVTISPEGTITDVNNATELATGVPRRALIGSNFSKYFTEPDEAEKGYQIVLAKEQVTDYPLTIRHVSGRTTDVLYNAAVFRDEGGEVQGVFAAARDITARKRAEEAVKAERQRFNEVLDVLPAYVVLLTQDYHVPFSNRYFQERFGESHGRRCFEYLFERTEPCEVCETYEVLKTMAPHKWEWTGPDGRVYDISDFPFTDTDGTLLILEMGIDITKRKQAEAELEKYRLHLEELVKERTSQLEAANAQLQSEVAERKRAEQDLRILASFPAENPNPVLRVTKDRILVYANKASSPLLDAWGCAVGQPAPSSLQEEVDGALSSGKGHEIEFAASGRVHSLLFAPVLESEYVNVYGRDVTERKRAEYALVQNRDRFVLLAEIAGALLETDQPQGIVDSLCSRVMAHLDCHAFFNFLADEQAGKLHLNSYAGVSLDEAARMEWLDYGQAVCGCAARDGCRIVAEHIPSTPDPRTDLVRSFGIKAYACHPLLGPNGKVIGTLSFGTRSRETFSDDDLVLMKVVADHVAVAIDRIKAEQALRRAHDELERRVEERTAELSAANEALRRSEASLAEAQRIAHLGSWDWDIVTNGLAWSDEVFRIFGFTPQEFEPTYPRFLERVHSEDRAHVEEGVRKALDKVEDYSVDHRIVLPNNDLRIAHEQGEVRFDDNGAPVRMLGTVMDITERVRAEEEAKVRQQQLIQADKMVSLGILVSGVAHEINNPNHAIMSNVQTLQGIWESTRPILERYYGDSGDFVLGGFDYSESRDTFPEMFGSILASSRRIQLIVDELRDFARQSPAEQMNAVDVNAVVRSAVILVSNLIKKTTDRFSVEYASHLPLVFGNFQRIEQVVINLVQNACHSLPSRDKEVCVVTRYLPRDQRVVIEVGDEGTGIPEEDLKHLGDPFFTTKRAVGGTGLGLWVSFSIVHEHGGALTFSSKGGEGTRATLALPIDQRQAALDNAVTKERTEV
jgi:PAS domain S-box-containing protein